MSNRDKQSRMFSSALIVSKPTNARPPHPTKSMGPSKSNTISGSIIQSLNSSRGGPGSI